MRRVFIAVLAALVFSGCAATMKNYDVQRKCAWCNSQIVNMPYEIWDVSYMKCYQVLYGGRLLGEVQTYDDAVKLCDQHALRTAGGSFGLVKEKITYCSLRCINAYEASTGIKEQRVRVIQGE